MTLYPCKEGIADITAPIGYSQNHYFNEVGTDQAIRYLITSENVLSEAHAGSLSTMISLDLFSNNDDELCPLRYFVMFDAVNTDLNNIGGTPQNDTNVTEVANKTVYPNLPLTTDTNIQV